MLEKLAASILSAYNDLKNVDRGDYTRDAALSGLHHIANKRCGFVCRTLNVPGNRDDLDKFLQEARSLTKTDLV